MFILLSYEKTFLLIWIHLIFVNVDAKRQRDNYHAKLTLSNMFYEEKVLPMWRKTTVNQSMSQGDKCEANNTT